MMRGLPYALIAGAALALGTAPVASAQIDIQAELFASGLVRPVFVTHAPGDFDRVFVLEQRSGSTGRIRVLDRETGAVNATPFLSLSVSTASEQGLLGMAFHPNFEQNGLFYVNYTRPGGDTVIAEYAVSSSNPDVADTSTVRTIMIIDQPASNHNAGWIGFSPWDGYLYIPNGDGGGGNDTFRNGQNLNTLLGSVLRIDVDGDDFPADASRNYAIPADNPFVGVAGADEAWAYGLRNPYRCSFDRATGDFWMGDVGQSSREEVNAQAFDSMGGENYGWRCREGFIGTGLSGCSGGGPYVDPIDDYPRVGGQCSVIGGYVYRGCAIPEMQGTYIYGDYCSSDIWTFTPNASLNNFTDFTDRTSQLEPAGTPTIGLISSFGEDAYGEIYITDLSDGEIYKIVPADPTPRVDCNANGVEDDCEILDGSIEDADNSGVPDVCEIEPCGGDFDGDGDVDFGDFGAFVSAFDSTPNDANWNPAADFDQDGDVDFGDFGTFVTEFDRDDCPV